MKDTKLSASIQILRYQAASLLLYQSVLQGEVGTALLELLQEIEHLERNSMADSLACLRAYGRWFQALASRNQNWQTYLLQQMTYASNPFSQQAQTTAFEQLPPALVAAAQQDLRSLQALYGCTGEILSHWVQSVSHLNQIPVAWEHSSPISLSGFPLTNATDWGDTVADLADYYRHSGAGLFAQYRAFRWQSGQLVGIEYPDPVAPADLAGYDSQQVTLIKNTEFLLAGLPALHVLLYGSRGSGKSSLVKSLLTKYGDPPMGAGCDRCLRLVEVAKSDLRDLPTIVEYLRHAPQKFIIFVDDLSFEDDDEAFKALKVVLEGNLTARPANVVVYATSNRRHLIREFFSDRPQPQVGDEINAWDTVQEKLSFSDRFGLTLTFEPADQKTYLTIVQHLANQVGIALEPEKLEYQALQWATRHNGRSGRTARQFIDFLTADLAMPSRSLG